MARNFFPSEYLPGSIEEAAEYGDWRVWTPDNGESILVAYPMDRDAIYQSCEEDLGIDLNDFDALADSPFSQYLEDCESREFGRIIANLTGRSIAAFLQPEKGLRLSEEERQFLGAIGGKNHYCGDWDNESYELAEFDAANLYRAAGDGNREDLWSLLREPITWTEQTSFAAECWELAGYDQLDWGVFEGGFDLGDGSTAYPVLESDTDIDPTLAGIALTYLVMPPETCIECEELGTDPEFCAHHESYIEDLHKDLCNFINPAGKSGFWYTHEYDASDNLVFNVSVNDLVQYMPAADIEDHFGRGVARLVAESAADAIVCGNAAINWEVATA